MRVVTIAMFWWVGCAGGDGPDRTDTGPSGSDPTVVGDLVGVGDPVTPGWQLLWGHDSSGASYQQEGTIDLISVGDELLVLADRRYGGDSFGRTLPLLSVAGDGSGATALVVQTSGQITPRGIAEAPEDDVYLVVEDEPVIARVGPKGELRWVHSLERKPYAFGGMNVWDVAGYDDDLYIAGAYNPSEQGDERGFVARVDADGAVAWSRSWPHVVFNETQRLSVGASGVCVVDRVPGTNELDTQRVVFGFGLDGTAVGQAALRRSTRDGVGPAVYSVAVAATPTGCDVVGTRSNVVDENFGLYVYWLAFDLGSTLDLTTRSGTWIPFTEAQSPTGISLTRHTDGALTAGMTLSGGPALLHLVADEPARLYDIEGPGGAVPAIDDEDYRTHVVARANGAVVVAATAEAPGGVQLTPYDAAPAELPLAIVDAGVSIVADAVESVDAKKAWTVADDTLGEVDAPQKGDQDVWLLEVTP